MEVEVLVRLQDVRKTYEDGTTRHAVLAGVTAGIRAGELVALLGPSGSGKSTLLNVIAGLDTPDSGVVEVLGRDVARLTERDRTLLRRKKIGFVFQFFNLVPTLTVQENVTLPLALIGVARREAEGRAQELLARVELAHRGRSFPDELSGGEQQRVAIARALAHGPALLLADEPTGNLDSGTGAQVLDMLAGVLRERGTTMLVATHSAEVVARASRVIALRDGLIEATS